MTDQIFSYRSVLIAFLALVGGSHVLAQQAYDWISASEMREELFGISMMGVVGGDPNGTVPWEECVDPDGHTRYSVGNQEPSVGVMTVSESGHACFNYGSADHCFRVARRGDNYTFRTDGGTTYVTLKVVRDIRQCRNGLVS